MGDVVAGRVDGGESKARARTRVRGRNLAGSGAFTSRMATPLPAIMRTVAGPSLPHLASEMEMPGHLPEKVCRRAY